MPTFVDVTEQPPAGFAVVSVIRKDEKLPTDIDCPQCSNPMSLDHKTIGETRWTCHNCGALAAFEPGYDRNHPAVCGRIVAETE